MTKSLHFNHRSASCELIIWDEEHAAVSNVCSKELFHGHASGLLKKVTSFADENDLRLILIAQPFGKGGLTLHQLVRFYKKFDFVNDVEPNKFAFMERMPQKPRP